MSVKKNIKYSSKPCLTVTKDSLLWMCHSAFNHSPLAGHVRVKLLQSCLTLCDPKDYSLPGSCVHGILPARILEWVAVPSYRGSSQPRDQTCISYISCIDRQALYHSRRLGSPSLKPFQGIEIIRLPTCPPAYTMKALQRGPVASRPQGTARYK